MMIISMMDNVMTVLINTTMMIQMTMIVFLMFMAFIVGADDYELYHDPHGSDGCGIYCVARCVALERKPRA